MLISYNWLKTYFNKELPKPEEVAHLFTFGAFEVEGLEAKDGDAILDLKVLPDRACYALSHRGIAYELSAIADLEKKPQQLIPVSPTQEETVSVKIENPESCRRYIARKISSIGVEQSPEWLRTRLGSIGQRSINTIVDATNFVMFDMGQPLHAFDADKVVGGIVVRQAKEGEQIELLPERLVMPDGTETRKPRVLALTSADIVIADDRGPIALAGIKGGLRAAVTAETKNIILESANFNSTAVRKTSTKYNLRNDSSKRFENGITPEFAIWGMEEATALIAKLSPGARIGPVSDAYSQPQREIKMTVSPAFISESLGTDIREKILESIFTRLHILFEKKGINYEITPPFYRQDLLIPEDIVEEIGRIYGYGNIPARVPVSHAKPEINPMFYWSEKIKNVLIEQGFSEVSTYALVEKGDVEIRNPLASDKSFLRNNLTDGIVKSLELNARNAPLLGLDVVKIFEIGTTFTKSGEETHCALGITISVPTKNKEEKIKEMLSAARESIESALGLEIKGKDINGVFEFNLSELIPKAKKPGTYDIPSVVSAGTIYKPISPYPFATRDIAVFTPEGTEEKVPKEIIARHAGNLLARCDLFDVFLKQFPDGGKKTSYAFRLVLQSYERTLTEEEINGIMKAITDEMNARPGWQVR